MREETLGLGQYTMRYDVCCDTGGHDTICIVIQGVMIQFVL